MNDMNDKINCGLYRRKTKILRDDLESLEIKTLLIVTTHRPQEFVSTFTVCFVNSLFEFYIPPTQ